MPKVRIEIRLPLTNLLKAKRLRRGDAVTLQKDICEGDTVGDLLRDLVATEKKLGKYLFDKESGRVTDQISIALNGRFIDLIEGPNSVLKDGDNIMLFTAWSGG